MKIEQKRVLVFCEAILALSPECRIWLKREGLESMCVDTANVAMVFAKLPATAFEEYKEESAVIGIDIPKLKTAVGIMKDGAITIKEEKSGKLTITDGQTRYSNTPLDVNTVRKDPNPPNIQLPAVIEINPTEFDESIKQMSRIGDKIRFTLNGNRLTLVTEGDTDNLVKDIEGTAVSSSGGPVSSLFSADYLQDIRKVMKAAAGNITISMNTDHPIRIEGVVDGVEIIYLLAPRIEAE